MTGLPLSSAAAISSIGDTEEAAAVSNLIPQPLPVPPPTVSSSLAATTSTFPAGKDEEEEEEKGIDFGELVENPSDPKELKKQKRLIRNRMSAQLHRERKRAYIDKVSRLFRSLNR